MKTSQVEDKKPEPEYYIWNKGSDIKLSNNFKSSEFSCHCKFPECVEQRISSDLINRLEKIRTELGQPIHITSGYRCTKYQKVVADSGAQTAKGKSQHELGNAADIAPQDGDCKKALVVANKYFIFIGIANSFLHLDTRPENNNGLNHHWYY